MWILLFLITLTKTQTICPSVFLVAQLYEQPQLIAYSLDYNYIAISTNIEIYIMQGETGTFKEILTSPQILSMAISKQWLVVGGNNIVLIYALDQMNHIANQVSIIGKVTTIQIIDELISVGTDNSYGFLWDPTTNQIIGRSYSNIIQKALVFYQINRNTYYDTIYIGTQTISTTTTTYLQYYTQNLYNLLFQQQLSANYNTFQISTSTNGAMTTSYLYTYQNSNLIIFTLINNAGVVTLTQQPNLNVGFTINQIIIQDTYISIFGTSCQYVEYDTTTSTFGTLITWSSSCIPAQSYIFQPAISLLISLSQTINSYQEVIYVYQFNRVTQANQIRSIYYIPEQLTSAIVLSTEYTISSGITSGNLYIYNQWFQMAVINNPTTGYPLQIIEFNQNLIFIQYSYGVIVSVTSSSITCQFANFQCYSYTLSQQSTATLALSNYQITVFSYQSNTYLLQVYSQNIYLIQYTTTFQPSQLFFNTYPNTVIQLTTNTYNSLVYLLLNSASNNLLSYPFPYIVSSTGSTETYTISGQQIAFNSQYLISNNINSLNIYQLSDLSLLTTLQYLGVQFKQIAIYQSTQLVILESNLYYIQFADISTLLQGSYNPYNSLQLTSPSTGIAIYNNLLLVNNNYFSMYIQTQQFFNGNKIVQCSFTQSFGGNSNFIYVSVQNSFKIIQTLYQTLSSLQVIIATINIESIVLWEQIVVNQVVNQNVQLTIQQSSTTSVMPSLIVVTPIIGLKSLTISNVNFYVSTSCLIQISSISIVSLQSVTFIQKDGVTQCPFFELTDITTFTLNHLTITGTTLKQTMFILNDVTTLNLQNILLTDNQISAITQLNTPSSISLINVQLQQLSCYQQIDQLIQYYFLNVNNLNIQSNSFCSTIFSNLVIEYQMNSITLNQLTISNNIFTKQQYAYLLVCLSSANDISQSATLTVTNLQTTGNTISPAEVNIYALFIFRAVQVTISDSSFTDSGIYVMSVSTLNYNNLLFDQIPSVGIYIDDCPSITLTTITMQNIGINNLALIMIQNIFQDKDTVVIIDHADFLNSNITSTQIIYSTFAISMSFKGNTLVTLNDFFMQGFRFKAADQSFITTSTGINVQGFETKLQIQNSNFINNIYSISTSLFVLNLFTFNMVGCVVNGLTTESTQFFGSGSENGGVGQVAVQFLALNSSIFKNIQSLNGAILYIQPFSADTAHTTAILQFNNLNISEIYCFGSAAFYVDNSHMDTNLIFDTILFTNVYALSYGAILYMQEVKTIAVPKLNLDVTPTEIKTIEDYGIDRSIVFTSCTFQNVFSDDGTILSAQYYSITMDNCNFVSNVVQDNYFTLAQQITGYLISVKYSQLIISNTIFNNLTASSQIPSDFSILNSQSSWISIDNFTIQNSFFRDNNIIQADQSYIKCISFMLINNTIIGQRVLTDPISPIFLTQSAIYFYFLQMFYTTCTLPQCVSGGIYLNNSKALIQNAFFWGNKGNLGGAMYINMEMTLWTLIDSSNFTQNIASTLGGAIFAKISNTSEFNVTSSDFFLNHANDSGGAIYTTSTTTLNLSEQADLAHIFYINNTYANNSADKYGGGMKLQVYYPYMTNITYRFNQATIEGNEISSYPSFLFLCQPLQDEGQSELVYNENLTLDSGYNFLQSGEGLYQIHNVRSGVILNQPLIFILKSNNNQTMFDDRAELNIIQPSASSILGTDEGNLIKFRNGSFNLTYVQLVGVPGQIIGYNLQTDAIKSIGQYNYLYSSLYQYSLIVQYRICLIGEIIQTYNDQTICSACPIKFYSFTLPSANDTGQCQNCPVTFNDQLTCLGGARTDVKQNYWRESVISLDLIQCTDRLSYCVGGVDSNLCGAGYIGPLCQECDYANGYARDTKDLCVQCANATWPLFQIITTSLGVFLYLGLSIYFVAQDVVLLCIIPCINQLLPPKKKIGVNLSQVKDLNSLMKIFLAYFQITSIVKYVTQNLPIWVEQVSDPNILSFSLECPLLKISHDLTVPMIYLTYLTQVSMPILCLLVFFLIYAIIFRHNKIYRNVYVASTWLVLWLFFLPNFYKKTLYLLNCKKIGSKSYVQADLVQECYQTEHFFYALFVSVPCLLFFVFYIPIMILYKIHADLTGNQEKRPLRRYKYYYINGEFKEKYYFWEFIRLAEKLLIQTAIEVFSGQVIYMSECCLIIVLVYGIYSFEAQPYGYKQQNFVNVVASLAAFTTVYLALVIATLQTGEQANESPIIILFQVLMAIVNILFIAWILWKIFIVLLPVLFVNIEEIQKSIAQIGFLRTYLLTRRMRTRLLFQRLGQKIIVINIIKKKTKRKLLKTEIKKELLLLDQEDRLSTRRRQRTAAQDALDYILKLDNPELQNTQNLTGWVSKDEQERGKEEDDEYMELPNFTMRHNQ